MDFLTHAAAGFFLSGIVDTSLETTLILTIASVFPDIDLIFIAFGEFAYFEHHRKFTHSIPGILIFSAIIASFFSNFWQAFMLCVFGMGVHVIYDLTNHFGTEVLYPFKKKRYALEFTSVVEINLYAIYFVCGALLFFYDRKSVSALAITLTAIYFVIKYFLHHIALNYARLKYKEPRALPHFFNTFKWHIISENKEKTKYILSEVNLAKGSMKKMKSFEKAPQTLRNQSKKLREFFDFAIYPIIEVNKNEIKVKDLRFFSADHLTVVLKNHDIKGLKIDYPA